MFRNLIFGSLLAPLGAALPVVGLFLVAGLLGAIFSGNAYALTAGIGQSFYALYGAYFFGWPAALVIGGGNGVVWLLVKRPFKRLLLSPAVGFAATTMTFGSMLVTTSRPLDALPALLGFGVLGAIASLFSAVVIFSTSGRLADKELPA